jgi:His-Xaa-Ser system radical SAM maturase HxsC
MLKLAAKHVSFAGPWLHDRSRVLRVTTRSDLVEPLRPSAALLMSAPSSPRPAGFAAYLLAAGDARVADAPPNTVELPSELAYLADGDVIRIRPNGDLRVVYRVSANANSFLLTERCNNFCVMCSQPPRDVDDGYIVDEVLEAIPLLPSGAREVGLTGGEPTLLGDRLLQLIRTLKANLPATSVHVLSNGRAFSDEARAASVARITHPDLMFGIPLYSDVPAVHDYVVQAAGAFDETVRGIVNLKRNGVRVEIRMVLQDATIPTLGSWATFVSRNLQFVDHVALMGLELMGFARSNLDAVWREPSSYQRELAVAVDRLDWAGIRTSIYNLPLCLLDRSLWRFAVKSISDWKNDYLPECAACEVRTRCTGFFSSTTLRVPQGVHAISERALHPTDTRVVSALS